MFWMAGSCHRCIWVKRLKRMEERLALQLSWHNLLLNLPNCRCGATFLQRLCKGNCRANRFWWHVAVCKLVVKACAVSAWMQML